VGTVEARDGVAGGVVVVERPISDSEVRAIEGQLLVEGERGIGGMERQRGR
jgi:hypothetical protein